LLAACALAASPLGACGGDTQAPPKPTLTVFAISTPPVALVQAPIRFQAVVSRGKPPYTYGWLFGDGATSDLPSPAHAYQSAGTYTVRVEVVDSANERADAQLSVSVVANAPATAFAQAQPTSGEAPLSVQFTGTGGGDLPVAYVWEFGDGAVSFLQNPVHTYRFGGSYTATLTVTDATGDTAVQSVSLTVTDPPPPPAPPPPDRQPIAAPVVLAPRGTAPHTTDFVANATGGDGALAILWDFGDGATSTEENPSHTFVDPGRYRVQFTASDEDGDEVSATLFVEVVPDRLPRVTITQVFPVIGCGTLNTSLRAQATGGDEPYTYAWSFGDGTTGTGDAVTHLYNAPGNYTVRVTATDADGDTSEAQTTVFVFAPESLNISLSVNPTLGVAPLSVNYTLGTTCGRTPFQIDWSFGDGVAATGAMSLRHTFDAPGDYVTTVRVTDSSVPPVTRVIMVTIGVRESVPDLGIASFTAQASGGQVCYAAAVANLGSAGTAGCYGFRGSTLPAPCGVVAAIYAHRGTEPAPALAPASRVALLAPAFLGGSAAPVDLRACLGFLRDGADAVLFLPASIGPAERWPASVCLDRPPGTDQPWVAAALNDPDLLARRPDLAFSAASVVGGSVSVPGVRINEIAADAVELRGPPGGSLAGHTLEILSGTSTTPCALSGALSAQGFAVVTACGATPLALPAANAALRLRTPNAVLDLVGWGASPPASEGSPAPAIPTGLSLGRVPDGIDTGRNAIDVVALPARSLGSANPKRGDLAAAPLALAQNTCALHRIGAGTQVVALDLPVGRWRVDLVALDPAGLTGASVRSGSGGACDAGGAVVASGSGDALALVFQADVAGRYCAFVDGAASAPYAALLTPAAP
jgi:PKD repeat protein